MTTLTFTKPPTSIRYVFLFELKFQVEGTPILGGGGGGGVRKLSLKGGLPLCVTLAIVEEAENGAQRAWPFVSLHNFWHAVFVGPCRVAIINGQSMEAIYTARLLSG